MDKFEEVFKSIAPQYKGHLKKYYIGITGIDAIVEFDEDATLFDLIGLENDLNEIFHIDVEVTSYWAYKKLEPEEKPYDRWEYPTH